MMSCKNIDQQVTSRKDSLTYTWMAEDKSRLFPVQAKNKCIILRDISKLHVGTPFVASSWIVYLG